MGNGEQLRSDGEASKGNGKASEVDERRWSRHRKGNNGQQGGAKR